MSWENEPCDCAMSSLSRHRKGKCLLGLGSQDSKEKSSVPVAAAVEVRSTEAMGNVVQATLLPPPMHPQQRIQPPLAADVSGLSLESSTGQSSSSSSSFSQSFSSNHSESQQDENLAVAVPVADGEDPRDSLDPIDSVFAELQIVISAQKQISSNGFAAAASTVEDHDTQSKKSAGGKDSADEDEDEDEEDVVVEDDGDWSTHQCDCVTSSFAPHRRAKCALNNPWLAAAAGTAVLVAVGVVSAAVAAGTVANSQRKKRGT